MAAYNRTGNTAVSPSASGRMRSSAGTPYRAYPERRVSDQRDPRNAVRTGRNIPREARLRTGDKVMTEPVGKPRYYYDYSLFFAVIFMFALGLLIIYSSSQYTASLEKHNGSYYFTRQLFIGSVGLVGAVILSLFDYRLFARILNGAAVNIIYWVSVGLLVMTLVMGIASHGKARWISIAGVSFQPAEVAKIALILFLGYFISVHGPATKKRKNLLRAIFFSSIPTLLILKQNISSAVIVAVIAAVMIFVAIDEIKFFAVMGTIGVAGMISAKPLIRMFLEKTGYTQRPEQYYLRRILGWAAPELFPDDAYQTIQSLYAIGSGGLTGHGLGESIQKFGKIPEVQNDMIFSIVCEEFGFIGAATLIILFIYIIYRIYQIAVNADDLFGTMICTGVMAHLGAQVVFNIAVVTGVMPNTGVTLPFISYGGSAILFTMAEIGLVLSVAHKIKIGER
ncbi:MAG: FtsW/RodA/SpoVE family cell cycle protein [Eubacteriales bacterium]|nr:FtsW/RodA/SpoVE family cell cycle protein [Eubacteriales bacterium]